MRCALAAFAGAVLMIASLGTQPAGRVGAAPRPEPPGTERRQIHFATPGGTRIIWELNPRFTLQEALP